MGHQNQIRTCLLSMHHAKTVKVESHSCEALGDGTSWHSGLVPTQLDHQHLVSCHGPIIHADFPLQTVSNALSQSVCQSAQMFGPLTVCPRFMSPGAPGPRGYHIMRVMALLSRVPSQKTRQVGAGRRGHRNPKYVAAHTKDVSLVVRR